jgi:hypothetical protein
VISRQTFQSLQGADAMSDGRHGRKTGYKYTVRSCHSSHQSLRMAIGAVAVMFDMSRLLLLWDTTLCQCIM